MLTSCLCTQAQMESKEYEEWCARIREVPRLHRKQWEFVYIAQALYERGMLAPGKRGLGFGVGQEPLAALFASYGCQILATDQDPNHAQSSGWIATGQYPESLAALNERGICDKEKFVSRVNFRVVDMRHIPEDLTGFDFVWSSCALEHLGSIRHGQDFIANTMKCLRPGGVAVHTTEYNVSSNKGTISSGITVLFRRKDIEAVTDRLRRQEYQVNLNLDPGDGEIDRYIDLPPYKAAPHLKLAIGRYVSTSIGLIIERPLSHVRREPMGVLARIKDANARWISRLAHR